MFGVRALGVLIVTLALAIGPAAADEEAGQPLSTPFLGENGELRLLVLPDFRDAPSLVSDLARFGIEGLTIQLVGPLVLGPDPKAPPIPSRLVLSGLPEAVAQGREVLGHLDVPRPTVLVSLLAMEVDRASDTEIGGHFSFDRDREPTGPNTLFRGVYSAFEPDAYLRSSLVGARPFQGTSVSLGFVGKKLEKYGALEYVLRFLAAEGKAEFLAWPCMVCSEGLPGTVTSFEQVPQFVTSRVLTRDVVDDDGTLSSELTGMEVIQRTDEIGVRFTVRPVKIGTDVVRLEIDADLRFAEPQAGEGDASSPLSVRTRRVTTQLEIADQETLMVGGLTLRRKRCSQRGLPVLRVPGFTSTGRENSDTELVLLVRARILVAGGGPPYPRTLPPRRAPPAPCVPALPCAPAVPRVPAVPCVEPIPEAPPAPPTPADDVTYLTSLFEVARRGAVVDGTTLSASTQLVDGAVLVYPAGVHRLDLEALNRRPTFPRHLLIEGRGRDATLLELPAWDYFARGQDVHGLTFRNCTLHCRNAPLRVTTKRFSVRLDRCRVIGFDRGAPGGPVLVGGTGAVYATRCRFEVGWGSKPGLAEMFATTGDLVARVEDSLIRGPLLSLYQTERAHQLYLRCQFVDLPRERETHLRTPSDAVRFVQCTSAWLPPGAELYPDTRPLSELNPAWR